MWIPPEIMWPARDDRTTMHHSCQLVGSHLAADLGPEVPMLFPFNLFLSYCMLMLLLIALLGFCVSMLFLTWSLFGIVPLYPVHPRLFHPHGRHLAPDTLQSLFR